MYVCACLCVQIQSMHACLQVDKETYMGIDRNAFYACFFESCFFVVVNYCNSDLLPK